MTKVLQGMQLEYVLAVCKPVYFHITEAATDSSEVPFSNIQCTDPHLAFSTFAVWRRGAITCMEAWPHTNWGTPSLLHHIAHTCSEIFKVSLGRHTVPHCGCHLGEGKKMPSTCSHTLHWSAGGCGSLHIPKFQASLWAVKDGVVIWNCSSSEDAGPEPEIERGKMKMILPMNGSGGEPILIWTEHNWKCSGMVITNKWQNIFYVIKPNN